MSIIHPGTREWALFWGTSQWTPAEIARFEAEIKAMSFAERIAAQRTLLRQLGRKPPRVSAIEIARAFRE